MEPISFAISTVDYAIQIASHIKHTAESYHHNPFEYENLLSRFHSIRNTLHYLTYSTSIDLSSPIWGSAFTRISDHFQGAAAELEEIRRLLHSNLFRKLINANETSRRIKRLEDGVGNLQHDLDLLGFFTASNHQSASQAHITLDAIHDLQQNIEAMENHLQQISKKVVDNAEKYPQSSINQISNSQRGFSHARNDQRSSFSTSSYRKDQLVLDSSFHSGDVDILSRIKNIENTIHCCSEKLLACNLHPKELNTIISALDRLRKKCRFNPSDISISSQIGFEKPGVSRAFQGSVVLRDSNGFVSRVGRVAVKVIASGLKARNLQDIVLRHTFLLGEMDHPCVLKFYGAYWSHIGYQPHVEGELNWSSDCAFIITEYMPCNLRTAIENGMLTDFLTKLMLLRDVSSGVEYLHCRGVVHLNLKPENVFVRSINGELIGKAKIGDIGFNSASSKKLQTLLSSSREAFPAHMPPEGYISNESYAPSWDIWSLGALICILFSEGNKGDEAPEASQSESSSGKQAGGMDDGGYVRLRPGNVKDLGLRALAQKCLSTQAKVRPSATHVRRALERIAHDSGNSQRDPGDLMQATGKEHLGGHNGRKQDAQKAFSHFKIGVGYGNIPSLVNLGDCYFYGHGVQKNVTQGTYLYRIAAKAGYPSGQYRLGECYYKGDGVGRDVKQALELFTWAGQQGNAPAIYQLGCHHFNNREMGHNNAELAVEYWKQASHAGYHFAQYRLALCLETGVGVAANVAEAKMWYRKAANSGNYGAAKALENLS